MIELLQKFTTQDIYTHLDSIVIGLKALFETGDTVSFIQPLSLLRQLLDENESDAYLYTSYSNFQALFEKLIELPPGNEAAKANLLAEISSTEVLSERDWLQSKAE